MIRKRVWAIKLLIVATNSPLVAFAISHDDLLSASRGFLTRAAKVLPKVIHLYAVMDAFRQQKVADLKERGE